MITDKQSLEDELLLLAAKVEAASLHFISQIDLGVDAKLLQVSAGYSGQPTRYPTWIGRASGQITIDGETTIIDSLEDVE